MITVNGNICPHCGGNKNSLFEQMLASEMDATTVSVGRICSPDEEWAYKQIYGDLFYQVEHYKRQKISMKNGSSIEFKGMSSAEVLKSNVGMHYDKENGWISNW